VGNISLAADRTLASYARVRVFKSRPKNRQSCLRLFMDFFSNSISFFLRSPHLPPSFFLLFLFYFLATLFSFSNFSLFLYSSSSPLFPSPLIVVLLSSLQIYSHVFFPFLFFSSVLASSILLFFSSTFCSCNYFILFYSHLIHVFILMIILSSFN
jgi:hypothetical protein